LVASLDGNLAAPMMLAGVSVRDKDVLNPHNVTVEPVTEDLGDLLSSEEGALRLVPLTD
jgi:hypothetical protein